jgi:hypothetical protein
LADLPFKGCAIRIPQIRARRGTAAIGFGGPPGSVTTTGAGFSTLAWLVFGRSIFGVSEPGLELGLSRGYRPHRAFGTCRVLTLQLAAPIAEVFEVQPVPLAIFLLRQATKLPQFKVAAPECARRLAFFQSKGNVALLAASENATYQDRITADENTACEKWTLTPYGAKNFTAPPNKFPDPLK